MDIQIHFIATGASRAKAQVERIMSSITNCIIAAQNQGTQRKSLAQLAPQIQLVLNSTVNRIIGVSPLELLTGVQPHVPHIPRLAENIIPDSRSDLSKLREEASARIEKSAQYELERFEGTKLKVQPFQIGDLVVRMIDPRTRTKTAPRYKGVYKICEILENDRYLIKHLVTEKILKYPHDRLRRISKDELLPQLLDFQESPSEEENLD